MESNKSRYDRRGRGEQDDPPGGESVLISLRINEAQSMQSDDSPSNLLGWCRGSDE